MGALGQESPGFRRAQPGLGAEGIQSHAEKTSSRDVAKTHFRKRAPGSSGSAGGLCWPSHHPQECRGSVFWAQGLVGREALSCRIFCSNGLPGSKMAIPPGDRQVPHLKASRRASNLPASPAPSLCKQRHPHVLPY